MRYKRLVLSLALALVATAIGNTQSSSRYDRIMSTEAGRDTLKNLALWEDQRVTGDGKLFDYLNAPNPLVRLRTVEVIGRIQDPSDVARLLPMIEDRSARVVDETFFALGQLGSDEAVPALVKVCASGSVDHKILAAEALGKIGGEKAVETLAGLLHQFQASVRAAAAMALARAASDESLPALLILTEDPDPNVAWRVIYALGKVKSDKIGDKIQKFLSPDQPALIRAHTARTLGEQKHKSSVKLLCKALNDDDLRVVINAANALGAIGKSKAVEPLGNIALKHKSHHVRRAAAEALGSIGHKKAKDFLIQALLDKSTGVRIAAVNALAETLGKKADMFIGQALNDGDRLVRAAAIASIGTAKIKDRAGEMMKIVNKDSDPVMRAAAVIALGGLDVDEVPPFLVGLLLDEDWVVATEAATALKKHEYKESVPDLIAAYRSRKGRQGVDVRLQILEALKEFSPEEGEDVELLRTCVEDPDKRIRTLAADILEGRGLPVPPMKSDREFYKEHFEPSRMSALAPPSGSRRVLIKTRHGEIEVELYGDDAIQTVANFTALAEEGYYNNRTFHRVIPNFVIQGGCPRGDGWGDAGYYIRSEFNRYRYGEGYVGIAHSGKDTGGCQFFITHSPQHHLDGRYTIFGKVRRGMDVVHKMDQGDTMEVELLR